MSFPSISLRDNRVLLAVLLPLCVLITYAINSVGQIVSVAIIGGIGFVTVFFVSYRYPRYNIVIVLAATFFMPLLVKILMLYEIPYGIVTEGLCTTMLITLALNGRLSGIRSVPAMLLGIFLAYHIIEIANPYTTSRLASVLAIRNLFPFFACFFIAYSSIDTRRDVNIFLSGWLIMGLMSGIYALWQEFAGLPSWDNYYITYDEAVYGFLFVFGRLRKFSFFFNPSEFGMLMSLTGMAGLIMAFYAKERWLKIVAAIAAVVCLWAMIYTGSRTAMAILPAGLLVFAWITLNRRILIGIAFVAAFGTVMVLRPQGGAMWVMASAFSAADDPSMNVRLQNRAMMRSYILSNPIGYGLGSTGYLARKFAPGNFITTFNTDSEFVKMAVELGTIGLFIWCVILCGLFGYGVSVYFARGSTDWKPAISLILVIFFMIIVSHYTQEIFVSAPISLIYATMMAIIGRIPTKLPKAVQATEDTE